MKIPEAITLLPHKIGLANIIAVITLLLTLSTFYYQFWRVSYKVKATIISLMPNFNGAALATDIVFTNHGNRQCSIAKISLMSKSTFNDEKYKMYGDGFGIMDCAQAPFSINPNEVVSKQLLFGEGKMIPEYKIPQCLQDPNCLKADQTEYRLVFVVIDGDGNCHEIVSGVLTKTKKITDEFEIAGLPTILKLMPTPVKNALQSTAFPQLRITQPK